MSAIWTLHSWGTDASRGTRSAHGTTRANVPYVSLHASKSWKANRSTMPWTANETWVPRKTRAPRRSGRFQEFLDVLFLFFNSRLLGLDISH